MIDRVVQFWQHSYHSDKFAFYVELVSVIFTVAGSTLLAFSAAAPDMRIVYPLYLVGSVTGVISAWRRKMAWIMLLFVALSFVAIMSNVKNKKLTVITKSITTK